MSYIMANEVNQTIDEERSNRLDDERYRKMIGLILRACELAGYSVEERIVLKDKYTGKVYR